METIDQIKIDEGGYQAEVYLCSEGKMTWLYGRNISRWPIKHEEWEQLGIFLEKGFSQKEWADFLFSMKIFKIKHGLDLFIFGTFEKPPKEVMNILINMSYNMGFERFNQDLWPRFFKAIHERNWKKAAIEGRDSRWFNQVGQRSVRLMNSLENVK